MDLLPAINNEAVHEPLDYAREKPFIEANTIELPFDEVKSSHIIPVFIKDNEPLISHIDFIETALECATEIFNPKAEYQTRRTSLQ
jgi:hypothetical protein